jgi:hypothetical protein
MKSFNRFVSVLVAALFIFSSCGEKSDAKESSKEKEPTVMKKVNACSLISESDLATVLDIQVKQMGDGTFLEAENPYYHYVALCGFMNADLMVTLRLAQRKTLTNAASSRDISYKSQKKDPENILSTESFEVAGMPALYFVEKDKDVQIVLNVLTLYTSEFEASVVCPPEVTKEQMVKASEIIAASLKKIL